MLDEALITKTPINFKESKAWFLWFTRYVLLLYYAWWDISP